jgi:hypothetical protein
VPVGVRFDQNRKWVRVRFEGQFTGEDAIHVIRTARADATHQMWPMLVDATGATSALTDAAIDQMVEAVKAARATQGMRGHVALVADDDLLFSQFLIYEIRTSEIGVRVIRVFRRHGDAEEWLGIMGTVWKFGDQKDSATS